MSDDAKNYKNTAAPLGAGERATPIKLNHTTLRSLAAQGMSAIRLQAQLAGQDERRYLPLIKTGAEADMALANARMVREQPKVVKEMFARGDTVWDKEHEKRVTIMKTNVAFTQKGRPIHRVISKSGKSWLQKESRLEKLKIKF